jgi:Toprim domain-containing protein
MVSPAAELARRLARDAEAVCRHYLSNGRRSGRYWLVGDVCNTPGRSLFVRLTGPESGKGAAGNWTDAASGQYGDLLDLIALNRGLDHLHDALDEARAFLRLPQPVAEFDRLHRSTPTLTGSPESARRLFAMSRPIAGTVAEAYLREREITVASGTEALRFHPRCFYRSNPHSPTETWPALIAAVTDLDGWITGVHRTWLDPSGRAKAPIDTPRRAMGHLLGHGVRFGMARDTFAAGEGIETMLSLRMALPGMPILAALSANHLAAILFPPALRRLYIARDRDPAGETATKTLADRAHRAGIDAIALTPHLADFNEDLRRLGLDALRTALRLVLAPEDVVRFLPRTTP